MKNRIKVFIVDDHQIVIDGLISLLTGTPEILIAGSSNGDDNVLEKIINSDTQVVLMDISLGNKSGIDLTKELLHKYPDIKVIMLSMHNSEEVIYSAIDAGANGYLPKNTTKDEILQAIKNVFSGKTYYNSEITSILMDSMVNQRKKNSESENKPIQECLTNREIQTLKLFAQGFSNQEIADKLFISVRTVESHKTHIMQKLGYKTMVEMIKYAIKNKLIDL